ncbi:hypothetical protein ELI_4190 [Eubacterium callanderi]|uniref:Uncharacterized protein n=1 Tax=Eubacterium callanderi TaxID=53442 RepID=E3GQ83_9FIRM|nr:hypothetical protein ELI_4190 [Eubacterium callanderi]
MKKNLNNLNDNFSSQDFLPFLGSLCYCRYLYKNLTGISFPFRSIGLKGCRHLF